MKRFWRLRPDIVKIDRAVLRAAIHDDHARRVLKGVVRMMQDCGVRVVIEGAEDRHDATVALDSNADFVQGYYFARPAGVAANEARCASASRGSSSRATSSPATARSPRSRSTRKPSKRRRWRCRRAHRFPRRSSSC
jgi:predicted signal transduction protein with EAL and GGDEF domain